MAKHVSDFFSNLKWALGLAWEIDMKSLIFLFAITIVGAFLPAIFISLTGNAVNIVEGAIGDELGNFQIVIYAIAVIIVLQIFHGLYNVLPSMVQFSAYLKFSTATQIKNSSLMKRIPIRFFDDVEKAKAIDAGNNANRSMAYFLKNTLISVGGIIGIITLLVLAAAESPLLLLLGFIMVAVALPVGIYNARREGEYWFNEQANERQEKYYYDLAFGKSSAMEFRLFNLGALIRKNWLGVAQPMLSRRVELDNKNNLRNDISDLFSLLLKFAVIASGILLVYNQQLDIGGLVVFLMLFDQLAGQSGSLSRGISTTYHFAQNRFGFLRAMYNADYTEIQPYIMDESLKTASKDDGETIFELKQVSYQYIPEKYALRNVNLKIKKGEIVALVGSNGSGKSTLIKLLLGLYTPTEGQMFFKGENYANLNFDDFMKHTGVTFQDYVNFEFSIRENIAFGDLSQIDNDDAIMAAIKKGNAEKVIERLPEGINSMVGRYYEDRGVELSGGEWQRLAVCRALISQREIMILDEPAAKLDPIAEMEQFNSIRDTAGDKTAILISHRIGFARLADKIVVLDEGNLIEVGTHEQLIAKKGAYHKMFLGQAQWYMKDEAEVKA